MPNQGAEGPKVPKGPGPGNRPQGFKRLKVLAWVPAPGPKGLKGFRRAQRSWARDPAPGPKGPGPGTWPQGQKGLKVLGLGRGRRASRA